LVDHVQGPRRFGGANGTGKTTLLKVLAGIESLDYGSLNVTRGMSSGYLPQDGLSLSGRTVFAECMSVFASLHKMEREMEELTHKMGELDPASLDYAQVADRFHHSIVNFARATATRLRRKWAACSQVSVFRTRIGAAAPKNFPVAGRCALRSRTAA